VFRRVGRPGAGEVAVFEAVGVAFEAEDLGVVDEAAQVPVRRVRDIPAQLALVEAPRRLFDHELAVPREKVLDRGDRIVLRPVLVTPRRVGDLHHDAVHRDDVGAGRDEVAVGLQLGEDVLARVR
jgi:hypothetical protein